MVDFSSLLGGLDAAINDHLRDDGWVRPTAGGSDIPVRLAIEHPTETDRLVGASIERSRHLVEISVASVTGFKRGDIVLVGKVAPFMGWRVAEAPKRPGDGRHWRAEVESLGQMS